MTEGTDSKEHRGAREVGMSILIIRTDWIGLGFEVTTQTQT